jgi:Family of unknown function (DUF5856)
MKKFSDFNKFKKIFEQELPFVVEKPEETKPEETTTSEVTKSEPAKFASKIFESRQMAHVFHLQARGDGSFSQHKALEEYYEGILDLIDSFIEVYSGQYEVIENYENIDTNDSVNKNKIDYFINLVEFIKSTRYTAILKEDTHLQNIIDEMVALIYRTLYKLKNLH